MSAFDRPEEHRNPYAADDDRNPFASPTSGATEPVETDFSLSGDPRDAWYKSPLGLGSVVVCFGWLIVVLQSLWALLAFFLLPVLVDAKPFIEQQMPIPEDTLAAWIFPLGTAETGLQVTYIVVVALTIITFLKWFGRTHRNLPALGAGEVKYRTTGGIILFFIPIAHLVLPYKATIEKWEGSDPAVLTEEESPGKGIVGWWWVVWVGSKLFGQARTQLFGGSETIEGLLTFSTLKIIECLFTAVAAVLMTIVVSRISRMQSERRSAILALPRNSTQ